MVTKRTSHARATRIKADVLGCEWQSIGGCDGVLDVAHLNGDPMDNRPENLKKLCRTHHRLLDNGKIDPERPKMPLYVVRGGKRRYLGVYSGLSRKDAARRREWLKRRRAQVARKQASG